MRNVRNRKVLISICIPVCNEEENLKNLYIELDNISKQVHRKVNFEFIFTDNNSSDNSWALIQKLGKQDKRIRAFRFTRNIGFQRSIYFNFMNAKGDAAIQIDADLQDPPSLILKFIEGWFEGYKVVVGIRRERTENYFVTKIREFGYFFISKFAYFKITRNAGDFRLIDRSVIEILRNSNNSNLYLRGAISGIGFPEKPIIYSRSGRKAGSSKFNFLSILKLGLDGLLDYSNFIPRMGFLTFGCSLALSVIGMAFFIFTKVFSDSENIPPGFISLATLAFLAIAINSLFFSISIHYLQRIHTNLTGNDVVVVIDQL